MSGLSCVTYFLIMFIQPIYVLAWILANIMKSFEGFPRHFRCVNNYSGLLSLGDTDPETSKISYMQYFSHQLSESGKLVPPVSYKVTLLLSLMFCFVNVATPCKWSLGGRTRQNDNFGSEKEKSLKTEVE